MNMNLRLYFYRFFVVLCIAVCIFIKPHFTVWFVVLNYQIAVRTVAIYFIYC